MRKHPRLFSLCRIILAGARDRDRLRTMDTILCLGSAEEYWHIARVVDDPQMRVDPVARRRLLTISCSRSTLIDKQVPATLTLSAIQRGLQRFDMPGLPGGVQEILGLTCPVHVLAASGGTCRRSAQRVVHQVRVPLPPDSLVRIEDGLMVSTPEHLYLQAASQLDSLELSWFASELCALFSIHPSNEGGLLPAQPLTTLKRLEKYLVAAIAINAYGAKKALAGLSNAVEGAASRREIACAMRMFFPRAQGGRGIPKPMLNLGLPVDKRLASVHGWKTLSVDIAWPEARLAMEYDSDTYHLDPRRRARDNDKRAVLEQMGWRVVPFSTKQFDSLSMSDDAFQRIGAALGVRNRAGETRYDWQSRRSELMLRLWHLCEHGIRL